VQRHTASEKRAPNQVTFFYYYSGLGIAGGAVMGAVGGAGYGALSQGVQSALRLATPSEQSDYSIRQALTETFDNAPISGALWGGALGGGLGALGFGPKPHPRVAAEAAAIQGADAKTLNAAGPAAIAQVAKGQPVDVAALFPTAEQRITTIRRGFGLPDLDV
jgi:hypothetical protein